MSLMDFFFGAPLPSSEESEERVGPARGIPIFGMDALSSVAYGAEAALTVLLPLGIAGLTYILPLTLAIAILLTIVFFSYRQTIAAYPSGGGSYTVAKENLGQHAGIVAASALLIDYLLNVAVGISAGVGALVSALPKLQPHTLSLCLAILLFITFANLRGVREPGALFFVPVCLFVGCMFGVVAWGIVQTLRTGGHPAAAVAPHTLAPPIAAFSYWILLKAFASGCTALTGIEAVSNGVQAFQRPAVKNARISLASIIAILLVLLVGVAYLSHAYRIAATRPGEPGYQTLLSQLTAAVAGKGIAYFVTTAAILSVVCLSANTSFADFPRVCRSVALDGYLPKSLANRGRRLVFSEGILILAILAGVLLIVFGGVTDRLIPLFAVGAFLAFTMSQAGMVAHWNKSRGRGRRRSMLVNGFGAAATGVTTCVIVVAKFVGGAWIVALLIPLIVALMIATRRHYDRVERETAPRPDPLKEFLRPPLVVVPIERWSSIAQKAVSFAVSISADVEILRVNYLDQEPQRPGWKSDLAHLTRDAGLSEPRIVNLPSPYRFVVRPIIDHILELERRHKDRQIAVVVPTLVESHWYDYFLHTQSSELLSALLLLEGNRRVVVINVPWYMDHAKAAGSASEDSPPRQSARRAGKKLSHGRRA